MLAVISGFLQSGLMKVEQKTGIKIDGNDLFLLRWIADLRFKFPKKVIGEREFFSISYDQMSEDLPFLRISKAEMYKRIARLSDAGYLTKNNSTRGQRAYYRLGESFTYPYWRDAADQMLLAIRNCTAWNEGQEEVDRLPDAYAIQDPLGEFAAENDEKGQQIYRELGIVPLDMPQKDNI